MVEKDDSQLLGSLRGYLEALQESGLDELDYAEVASAAVAVEATEAVEVADAPSGDPTPGANFPHPLSPSREGRGDVEASIKVTGSTSARLLFVRPSEFAGASREMLANMIRAMDFAMTDICVVTVSLQEAPAEALREAVLRRIAAVGPEAVVAFGESAAQFLTGSPSPIAELRGRFIEIEGLQVMATLHPDQLVADEGLKRQVWHELKQVMARLGKG